MLRGACEAIDLHGAVERCARHSNQRQGQRRQQAEGVGDVERPKHIQSGWSRAIIRRFDAIGKPTSSWLFTVANYFHSRSSNGRTEGFNHGLRSILWRAFGMTSFENFRLRVLDRFGFASA